MEPQNITIIQKHCQLKCGRQLCITVMWQHYMASENLLLCGSIYGSIGSGWSDWTLLCSAQRVGWIKNHFLAKSQIPLFDTRQKETFIDLLPDSAESLWIKITITPLRIFLYQTMINMMVAQGRGRQCSPAAIWFILRWGAQIYPIINTGDIFTTARPLVGLVFLPLKDELITHIFHFWTGKVERIDIWLYWAD